MFRRKEEHECEMDVTGVGHEEIDGRKYSHILKICPTCKDWDIETLPGTWKKEQFLPAKRG